MHQSHLIDTIWIKRCSKCEKSQAGRVVAAHYIDMTQITSIKFKNYKAFREYSISLKSFNVLVGPNNAGKSTVIGALRILSEGIRKGRTRKAEVVYYGEHSPMGYYIDLKGLPVSTENVFHNYNDAEPATIRFRINNGNHLQLIFPEKGTCILLPEADRPVRSPADFKREFPITLAFVPVLGPVEHNERLYQADAAKSALMTTTASRNFRNIWYHYKDGFNEFKEMVRSTWPGMDIDPPVVEHSDNKTYLYMFCPEERYPRELFWAGFGFQVWCQMLTFIFRARGNALLVIDEPDIYLHSDLQRQLVTILNELHVDVVMATHSTEIISEVEPEAIVNVNKKFRSAKRVKNSRELQDIFSVLGSNLNPTLTQLAKTKCVVFVEGKDFQILSRFAKKLGIEAVANRSHFAVVPVGGFNPQKVKNFAEGMEMTLGVSLVKIAVFDRDYRCNAECAALTEELSKFCWHAVVHDRKEIENFLLHPESLARTISKRSNGPSSDEITHDWTESKVRGLLDDISSPIKNRVFSRLVDSRQRFEKSQGTTLHASSITEAALNEFDLMWGDLDRRLLSIPGKELFSLLNAALQSRGIGAITPYSVVDTMKKEEVWSPLENLIRKIDAARTVVNHSD